MTHSRREVLKGAAAVAAIASCPRRAGAQEDGVAQAKTRIDSVLKQAVDARDVPGVVAMAATEKGVLYEGAVGPRALDASASMTPDTVFRIASMTKAIASVAAMQLVEQGKLKLEEPVPNIDPWLASPQVLEGFDASGTPKLRPAKRPITLRHLLTHTAGFTYDIWSPETVHYAKATGLRTGPPAKSPRSARRSSSTRAIDGCMASTSNGSDVSSRRSAASRSKTTSASESSTRSG